MLLLTALLALLAVQAQRSSLEADLRLLVEGSTQAVYLAGSNGIINRGPSVVAELQPFLVDRDPKLRTAALDAMAFFPQEAVNYVAAIDARLKDEDVDVVLAAIELLRIIGDGAASEIESVTRVLEIPKWRFRKPGIDRAAGIVGAVSQFLLPLASRAEKALPILDRFLSDPKTLEADRQDVRLLRDRIRAEVKASRVP